jgi:hypothetical protein
MKLRINLIVFLIALTVSYTASPLLAQQKGQYVPGQFGLNAGVTPATGFTYQNVVVNYSASQLDPRLFSACHRHSIQPDRTWTQPGSVFQILLGIRRSCASTRTHDRVWFHLDLEDSLELPINEE